MYADIFWSQLDGCFRYRVSGIVMPGTFGTARLARAFALAMGYKIQEV